MPDFEPVRGKEDQQRQGRQRLPQIGNRHHLAFVPAIRQHARYPGAEHCRQCREKRDQRQRGHIAGIGVHINTDRQPGHAAPDHRKRLSQQNNVEGAQ